jgi:hypothetical protein
LKASQPITAFRASSCFLNILTSLVFLFRFSLFRLLRL